ncbi:succinate-semialdehyde dehydrogenase [Gallibacterium genomosp. 3]|uniref:Succinate-semialdehyde dehydrogenase n=1 Tax=Gallibacterium genomosp. 3 TaxID=505345 RepID=A0A1A7PR03_9PAST|nr:NAD-dependent succinate-semialdehyde dehydrogenase [Gallibacterium genomosp. 3]OBX05003.1 succinate-semialdehyde dehydrogenase [Gallibacterium genomosp. 3]
MDLSNFSLLRTQSYINGHFVNAESGNVFPVTNPATGEVLCEVSDAGIKETERALYAAQQAQQAWATKTGKERGQILRRWFDLVMTNQEELAQLLSLEQGKPLAESRGEIAYGSSFLEWFAEEAKRAYGDVIPQDKVNRRIVVIKQPIGVVAAITPWNFPNAMITRKAAPALASGCTMVLKPAPETPLSALALAVLAEQAGVPAGVFNVVIGTDAVGIGKVLSQHDIVKKLTFTGSTRVGKILMEQCASTVKKVALELGGNAPSIVFDDADLDTAIEGIIASKFRNAGQTCVCTNRIYVQRGIYQAFVEKFLARVQQMKVGSAFEQGVEIGPLINQNAVHKIEDHIADALAKGATRVCGGKLHALGGTFFEPTILTSVNQNMKVAKEETFAPLAPIFCFDTEEEAIQMANDTEFGLASYIYTPNMSRIWRVSEALDYGIVGINEGIISTEVAPFGGVKQSGLGREGSRYGLEEFMEMKYLCMKI